MLKLENTKPRTKPDKYEITIRKLHREEREREAKTLCQ